MKKFYKVKVFWTDEKMVDHTEVRVLVIKSEEEEQRLKAELEGEAQVVHEFMAIDGTAIGGNQITELVEVYE